jgi:RNA polymerase sigma factor (sigma-70 family)
MTTEEMMKMCRTLAHKYNSPSHFDDLVSEGILECLEQVDKGNTHGANLRRMANRAMHDYINLKTLPVKVPLHETSRSLARDTKYNTTMNLEGVAKLQQTIKSTSIPIESANIIDEESDPAVIYEKKQDLLSVIRTAKNVLSGDEWDLLSSRYLKEKTISDLATIWVTNDTEIRRRVEKCIIKVTDSLNISR